MKVPLDGEKTLCICVDFDGTVVTHNYPDVGDSIGAESVLKELVDKGHHLILNTMRSGYNLDLATSWFQDRQIPLYGVNEHPTQKSWTESPKVYGHLYIDDAALGCPLIYDMTKHKRSFVDWDGVRRALVSMGVLDG